MIQYHAYSVEEKDLLYGPGKRLVLWVMGCSIRCEGCINPHLWNPQGGQGISAMELVKLCSPMEIEGLTLLGGEPADQAEALLPALRLIKALGKTIVFFTGYEIEELNSVPRKQLTQLCDIIICGRFDQKKADYFLHFRGSTNQRILVQSKRYKDYKIRDGQNMVVLNVTEDGKVTCKGIPDRVMRSTLLDQE